jgi:hypothetical protein
VCARGRKERGKERERPWAGGERASHGRKKEGRRGRAAGWAANRVRGEGRGAGWAGPKGEKREGGKKKEEEQLLQPKKQCKEHECTYHIFSLIFMFILLRKLFIKIL